MQIIAGVDVHKRMLAVVVRMTRDGKTVYEKRKFGTTRQEIELHLAAWLKHLGVTVVVMESTAQYWAGVVRVGGTFRTAFVPSIAGTGAAGAETGLS
jgi:transposase